MKNLFLSLSGAVALSFVHLLIEMWRSLLDFTYVLPGYTGSQVNTMAAIAFLYTGIFAGWLLSLKNAANGMRGGILGTLLFGALFWIGIDLGTIFFYCPGGCSHVVFDISTWVSLVVGGAALYGLAVNLRRA